MATKTLSSLELSSFNVIPNLNDVILESDTGRTKIGDGVTRWNALPYSAPATLNSDGVILPSEDGGHGVTTYTSLTDATTVNLPTINIPLENVLSLIPQLQTPLVSGSWYIIPSISRLLLIGTGTVSIDSKDITGAITSAVYVSAAVGATNQVEFPYYGDNAVAINPTITGSLSVEIL